MDGVHGVDVSWLHHHSNKDHLKPKKTSSKPQQSQQPQQSNPDPSVSPQKPKYDRKDEEALRQDGSYNSAAPATPATPPKQIPSKASSKRGLLHRASSERLPSSSPASPEDIKASKRPGWISSLSSKFSSQSHTPTVSSSPAQNVSSKAQTPPATPNAVPKELRTSDLDGRSSEEDMEPYVPQHPKSSNFFSSAMRRLSSSSQQGPPGKAALQGSTCARRLLNVDKERERCRVKELDQKKLRRVAFSVDVEVVGISRYAESEAPVDAAKKAKDKKLQARSEGAALKNPEAFKEEKGKLSVPTAEPDRANSTSSVDDMLEAEMLAAAKRQEQDAARQRKEEKKEKKRKETGSLDSSSQQDAQPISPTSPTSLPPPSIKEGPVSPQPRDRPTTDPVRMYRRCCQLREAPVLKRISEQLGNMKAEVEKTGVVPYLDLNGSRMQLPDIVCLGDWLAIVPVRRLLLDNANLTDEGLRIILAGLLAAKPPEQSKRRHSKSSPDDTIEHSRRSSPGVIEKISLRMNTKVTAEGWRHICLFLNLSHSLKGIDMSLTPFPSLEALTSVGTARVSGESTQPNPKDVAHVLYESLSDRSKESRLEELILSDCHLNAYVIKKIVDAICGSNISRLGVAKNSLDHEAIQYLAQYIQSGSCKGLDLGGNDIRDAASILTQSMGSSIPIWALSLADCNLDPDSLAKIFPSLLNLPDFRFLDLSHNRDLFNSKPNALGMVRKYLPQLKMLRRIQFIDVSMLPEQAIAIAEIIPDVRNLNHISFLENPELSKLASASDLSGQEESCAYYASIMWAVRLSKTVMAMDVDQPTSETNEVIQALGKQIMAYAFRNIERYTSSDAIATSKDPYSAIPDKIDPSKEVQVPDILAHLVGHGDEIEPTDDTCGPDQDYIVGGTGVVKALSYVLGQRHTDLRKTPGTTSGNITPTQDTSQQEAGKAQARELGKNMLSSARKIRCRLQMAMQKEDHADDEVMLRRLQFLDYTLQQMITRFESEYPETAVQSFSSNPYPFAGITPGSPRPKTADASAEPGPEAIDSTLDEPTSTPPRSRTNSDVSGTDGRPHRPSSIDVGQLPSWPPDNDMPPLSSRRASTTSLAARAQAVEEGQMHRFGQKMRRDVLPPSGMDDHLHRTSIGDPIEPEHLQALRKRLEELEGDEIRDSVLSTGLEATVKRLGEEAEQDRERGKLD